MSAREPPTLRPGRARTVLGLVASTLVVVISDQPVRQVVECRELHPAQRL